MSRQQFGLGICLGAVVGLLTANVVTQDGLAGAQSASIVGRVVDGSGGPVPGVSVTAIAETGGVASQASSAENGSYQFAALPDGTYRVDFELLGFDVIRRNHVRVRQDTAAKVDATMFVSGICECVAVVSPGLRERSGQVVDESGRPLPQARLEVAGPLRSEGAYADREGRFQVRLPVNELWSVTAADGGFRSETQQVSGTGAGPLVFRLAHGGTAGLPDVQRFSRGCRCPGDLFTHAGR